MPAGFHDVRLPDRIEAGAMGGPEFNTTVIEFSSGVEQRNREWSRDRSSWDIGFGVEEQADYAEVVAFFRARYGRAYGFRFKDWSDFAATAEELGVGDGVNHDFQLIKTYSDAAGSYQRKITRPVSPTLLVYKDDVLQVSGFTINYATGLLHFTAAPAVDVVITATFEFDVPVRFDIDKMAVALEWIEAGTISGIPIRELRE